MRSFFWLLGSFLSCCFIWSVIVISQIGNTDPKTIWISDVYNKKEVYANTIQKSKLVIVAGSNALFGINSKKLEDYWHIPVVNNAVTEGFGLKYLLDRSKNSLQSGDIALLPLEYSFYQEESKITEHYANFILANDTNYFSKRSLLEKITIFARIEPYWALNGLLNKNKTHKSTATDIYGIHNINQRGDQINNIAERSETNRIIFENILPQKYKTPELSSAFIDIMNSYIQWAKKSDVCLIVIPPTYLYFESYQDNNFKQLHANIRHFYKDQQISFIGDFYKYMYSSEFYFNSRYHLNTMGGEQRTLRIIEDIGKTPALHCAVP